MNYEAILEVLKEKGVEVSELGYGDFNSEELGLGKCKQDVYSKGGEGEGEDWRRVHHFEDHNVFIEIRGDYSSYNGTEFYDGWDCVRQVTPQEKLVTVYE
jgi:hypothetical protein